MLTDQEKATLDFERQWWKYAGAKEAAIREQFDESPTRYYQRLTVLLERPEAAAYDGQTVNRLHRIQQTRRAQRTSRR